MSRSTARTSVRHSERSSTKPLAFFESLEMRSMLSVPPALGGTDRLSSDFSQDWKFIKQDVTNAQNSNVSDASWSTVSLPHTYNAADGADGGNDYFRGATWYRKTFAVPTKWKGRRIYIDIGAASTHAQVYVNGNLAGTHDGGDSRFVLDVTGYVSPGHSALIAIRVDNSYDDSLPGYQGDFTIFGGLTREVSLYATQKLALNPDDYGSVGVQIGQTNVSSTSATLNISASVRNRDTHDIPYTLRTSLVDAKGKVVADVSQNFNSRRGKLNRVGETMTVTNPHLWNGVADPYLYTAYIQVIVNGVVYDTLPQTIGIRSVTMDSTGLKLNGTRVQLHGVDLHDDKAGIGNAMTDADRARDVKLLLEMGANAVRFSHWEVDQDFYDQMDRAGIMVWTEIPLWRRITATQAFTDNATLELRELIRQNYNHPSIIFWGLYNELPNTSDVISLLNTVQGVAKSEDPTRLTIGATELDNPATINTIPDYIVFNKYYGWYGDYNVDADTRIDQLGPNLSQQKFNVPSDPLGLGEYGAGANITQHVNVPADGAPPSDPNSTQFHPEEYQAYFHEKSWEQIEASATPLFGAFVWEFADSANDDRDEGGTPGINDKGLVSADRSTPKDAFYYYKSQWSTSTVLYITSKRYTNRTDATTTVKIYSNLGTNVELKVNGVSQGTRNDSDGVLEWSNITLAAGANAIVVTTTKNGKTYTDSTTWTLTTSGSARAQSLETSPEPVTPKTPSIASDLFGGGTAII